MREKSYRELRVMRKYIIAILWVFLLFAVAFSPSSQLRAAAGGSLAVNFSGIPLSIDPETAVTDTEKILLANLHEGLVAWDNGILVPAAAVWRFPGTDSFIPSTSGRVFGPTGIR
jgi:ABC-type oligopeptide transport system substrate-binding subunit